MKTPFRFSILLTISILTVVTRSASGQCAWQTEISDGFEYTTTVPGLVPGKAVHSTPQSWAVYSGSYSLYLNFVTCTGTTGACAGDKIYERKMPACPFQRYRFSSWLTTSFAGTQCNVRITITDKLGNMLDDQPQIAAPYAPAWVQYQSPEVIPLADTIIFTLYTNVPGAQSGNDLSMDDFLMEKCFSPYTSTTPAQACATGPSVNLFASVPYQTDVSGTWSGPGTLTGGHLGTFDPITGSTGTYIYENFPFGNACPVGYDSVSVSLRPAPEPDLGADTSVCSTQTLLLNPGTGPGYTYLWGNGVTGPNVLAFAPGGTPVTQSYSVTVTDSTGCSGRDTITVNFVSCTGIAEQSSQNQISMYPNPTNGEAYVNIDGAIREGSVLEVIDITGRVVFAMKAVAGMNRIPVGGRPAGSYMVRVSESTGSTPFYSRLTISR